MHFGSLRMLRRLLVLLGCCLVSCTASVEPHQAAGVALDREQLTPRRINAVTLVPVGETDALYSLVWFSGHPMPLRETAVDRLINDDGEAFWDQIDRRIVWIDDWPMIRLLCERATADSVSRFIPSAVESWARPSTTIADADRPERLAIAALCETHTPEQVVRTLCLGQSVDSEPADLRLREAAWAVYARVASDAELRGVITQSAGDDPLLGPLAVVAPAVDVLPADREALLRLDTLVALSSEAQWRRRAAYRAAALDEGRVPGIAARHLPAIDHAVGRAGASREQLLTELRDRLKDRRHYDRGDDADGQYIEPRPERLADHAERVSRADLLALLLIDDAVGEPGVRDTLFEQADADRADTTTEYGGVLTWDASGEIVAQAFAPTLRQHDRIYFASDACVTAMHTGLAHYHFHVQQPDNAPWAGPGGGDVKFAELLHANCIVLTSVDVDTLNVDAYFPGGIVVDLGCIRR